MKNKKSKRELYIELYKSGMSYSQIARKFGVTKQNVHQLINYYEEMPKRNYRCSEANRNNSIYKIRIAHNMTQEQLAEKLGVSPATICNWESGSKLSNAVENLIMLYKGVEDSVNI